MAMVMIFSGGYGVATGGPLAWGLCYNKEMSPSKSYCDDDYKYTYPCTPGVEYFGRGALPIYWYACHQIFLPFRLWVFLWYLWFYLGKCFWKQFLQTAFKNCSLFVREHKTVLKNTYQRGLYGLKSSSFSFDCFAVLGLQRNYNYGEAGEALKVDLLNHPEYIEQNATLAFQAAIWRWMTPVKKQQPSAHDVFVGTWKPTKNDTLAKRIPGFGATMNVLYGDSVCGQGDVDSMNNIVSHYQYYLDLMGVGREEAGPHEVLTCAEQEAFNPSSSSSSSSSSWARSLRWYYDSKNARVLWYSILFVMYVRKHIFESICMYNLLLWFLFNDQDCFEHFTILIRYFLMPFSRS